MTPQKPYIENRRIVSNLTTIIAGKDELMTEERHLFTVVTA